MPPLFLGQFSQNSLVGDAWLKVSLVLQHTLYHPQKSWALLPKNFEKTALKQARKLQATLEGCNPKLWLAHSLTDGGKV